MRTVQGTLESALLRLSGAEVRVVGSGRTDAGVHAAGQVVGFRAEWRHGLLDLHRALNAVLPPDIAVVHLDEAPAEWHPRFSATVAALPLHRAERGLPLSAAPALRAARLPAPRGWTLCSKRRRCLWAGMTSPALAAPCRTANRPTRRPSEIFRSEWRQEDEQFFYDVVGNAFLRSMVRALVGSMLSVGLGQMTAERLGEVLAARDRSLAAPPALGVRPVPDAC